MLWDGECIQVRGEWYTPNSKGTEAPVLKTLLDLTLRTVSSSHSFVSFIINQNSKQVVSLYSVSYYSKLLNLRRGSCNLWFVAKLDRSVGNLGTHYMRLASRGQLWETETLTYDSCTNSGVSAHNCLMGEKIPPTWCQEVLSKDDFSL